jgi:hypothetical protein
MRGNLKIIFLSVSFLLKATFAQADSSLTFSEIMFSPQSGNNEFIEIFNLSETDSINLKGYKIIYSTSNADIIDSAGFGIVLQPKSFAVILEGDYDFASGIYNNLIPPEALILKISNNSFGTSGMANTADRQLWLVNQDDDTLEAYTYSANNSSGISDEKIIMSKDNSVNNWENSLQINGTPGKRNSATPLNYDLSFPSLLINPKIIIMGDDVHTTGTIKNQGTSTAQNFTIGIFNDTDFDSSGSQPELIFTQSFSNLLPDDSITINTFINSANKGNYQLIGKVNYPEDEDTLNNKKIIQFTVYPPGNNYNDIVINEIMYAPSSGEPEWIEVYNNTESSIDLKKWSLSDNSTTVTVTNIEKFVQGKSFIVLSRDSSILNFYPVPVEIIVFNLPALNNTGDVIVIKDSLGILIDSLRFSPEWGSNSGGKSLERINPLLSSTNSTNWKASTNKYKATPGNINSVTEKEFDLQLIEIIYSPTLAEFSDNVSIFVKVKNVGRNNAQFNIQFYDDTNLDSIPDQLITEIKSLLLSAGDSSIYSTGYSIQNLRTTRGFYAVINFVQDQDTSNNYLYSTIKPGYPSSTILVNEIMYTPAGGEPEWVEIFNSSADSINLKDWSITDVFTTPATGKVSKNIYFKPRSYLVLTKDSSIQNYYRVIPSKVIVVSLPSFNNDADGVVLKDNRGATIDSVLYLSEWGGKNGYSLERISLDEPTNDLTNWATSLSNEKSTPGNVNSVSSLPDYKRNQLVINEIMFDPGIDNSEFIEFFNNSGSEINIGGWQFEDKNGNINKLSDTSFVIQSNAYFILAADSLSISKYDLQNYRNKSIVGIPSLGLVNTGELILLKDLKKNVIDSVRYSDKWHNKNILNTKNKSLERINPMLNANDRFNWSTSVSLDGATPGKQNSIFTNNESTEAKISVSPNPFSPDNDGFEDFTLINYNITQTLAQVRIKIFDSKGRLVRTLVNNQASASSGSIIFDGLDDEGRALRIGIYIIFMEALNDNSGVVKTLKTTVVVARKL